jgi:hypothetical protein
VALTTVASPATVVTWLGKSRSAQLLGSLARTGDPITHDQLDDLPQTQALRYVRDMLVSSGVLPARNEHLERLAPWLEHLLHDKPAHHARPMTEEASAAAGNLLIQPAKHANRRYDWVVC